MQPGNVTSAERSPPPSVSAASRRTTERPARAIVIAAASPLGPAPTTTASGLTATLDRASLERSPRSGCGRDRPRDQCSVAPVNVKADTRTAGTTEPPGEPRGDRACPPAAPPTP